MGDDSLDRHTHCAGLTSRSSRRPCGCSRQSAIRGRPRCCRRLRHLNSSRLRPGRGLEGRVQISRETCPQGTTEKQLLRLPFSRSIPSKCRPCSAITGGSSGAAISSYVSNSRPARPAAASETREGESSTTHAPMTRTKPATTQTPTMMATFFELPAAPWGKGT